MKSHKQKYYDGRAIDIRATVIRVTIAGLALEGHTSECRSPKGCARERHSAKFSLPAEISTVDHAN